MPTFGDRLQHAWNAFIGRDPTSHFNLSSGAGYGLRPDRVTLRRGSERSMVTAVLNRIAVDCASIEVEHVRLDDNKRYIETMKSGLNECLTVEANIDQTGRAFRQDAVLSLLDEGVIALVPVLTDISPINSNTYEILQLRVGKIITWYPDSVKLRVYNEKSGKSEEIVMPKKAVAIIENPLYAVMNEQNSTLQRLIRKLAILDVIDEQSGSGKLDLIIQLPYTIKSDLRRQQAEQRRKDIEMQLSNTKYGIAYTDSTEHITQLNRSVENNLMNQIEYLTSMLYSQLGITKEVMDGSADEKTMNNYYSRTIEPIMSALVDEMKRKFLTKTARSQHQSICFFRDPFKLVPTTQLADLADRLTRNEVMTSNEFRQVIGMKPAKDPGADELRNKNISLAPDTNRMDVDGNPIDPGQQPITDPEQMSEDQLMQVITDAVASEGESPEI